MTDTRVRRNYRLSEKTLDNIKKIQDLTGLSSETAVIETAVAELLLRYMGSLEHEEREGGRG